MQVVKRLPGCLSCSTDPRDDKVAMEENGYDGYRCDDCGLIYVSPRPDPEQVANLYDHDVAHVSAQELIDASDSYGKRLKARLTLDYIAKYRPSGDLLEIGPGGGAFLQEAAGRGYRTHAAEFSPSQVRYMQSLNIDCRQGAFAEMFAGMTFDVIYHCDVLSHFFDPVAEHRAMREMLRPGGIVVLETGNFGDLAKRYYGLVERWQYPDHLFFFSKRSLANLAAAAGFHIEIVREYSRSAEMLVDRLAKPAKSLVKRSPTRQPAPGPGVSPSSRLSSRRRLRHLAMNLKHAMDFVLVYGLGSFAPRNGRPQTVIVVLGTDLQHRSVNEMNRA